MKNQFSKNGYVLVKNFLQLESTSQLLYEIHDIFRNRLESINFPFDTTENDLITNDSLFEFFDTHEQDYINCMKTIHNLLRIFNIGTSKNLEEILKEIGLKKPIFSSIPMINLHNKKVAKNDGYWKTPIHQDWRSTQGSLNCTVVWIPLIDVDEALGSLEVIPGSHLRGLLPAEKDDWYMHTVDGFKEEEFEKVPMKAGDALIFSAFLIHRSGTNSTNKIRYSLQFRFNDILESSFIQRGYPNPYSSVRPQRDLITPNFPKIEQIRSIFKEEN